MAKILLADDSGTAQRMGSQILSAEGHEVSTVSNGQAAIKMLAKFAPDLVVADVFMPGKSGYELCEHIKSDPESAWIPVLLIVAPMEPYDATEGKRVKADGLVTKPLDKSNLVETVQALLADSKRPAPGAAKKRGGRKGAEPKPEPFPEPAEMNELPADEDPTIPAITTNTGQLKIEIPEEMKGQPVSLVGELLEPAPEPAPPDPLVEEEFVIERSSGEERVLAPELESDTMIDGEPFPPVEAVEAVMEPASPELELPTTEGMPGLEADSEPAGEEHSAMDRLFASTEEGAPAEESSLPFEPSEAVAGEPLAPGQLLHADEPDAPAEAHESAVGISDDASTGEDEHEDMPGPEPYWTAEGLDVSKEDKDLFGSPEPDWQGLVDLVQEQGEIPAASLPGIAPPVAATVEPEPPSEPPAPEPVAELHKEPVPEPMPVTPAAEKPPRAVPEASAASDTIDTISTLTPQIAPLDYATVEQIVRETIEEIMPRIVERISQATGVKFAKSEPKEPNEE